MAGKIQNGIAYYKKHGFRATMHRVFIDDYAAFSKLPPERYEEALKKWYKRTTGKTLNLDDPKTFNEKIQWLKLYDSTPIKTRLADKYLVRDWVKEKIGEEYLIPLLGVWDSFDEIDFDQLPDQFVLKANHGCGWNIIVKDKSKFDIRAAREKFNVWMHTNYAFKTGLELHYMNVPPKIIAEKYVENEDDDLRDYKVFCFNGNAKFICVDSDRFTGHHRALYSLNWERMPEEIISYPSTSDEIPRPKNLEKMITFSQVLSQEFALARIDFYEAEGKLYFGEITFTSASGTAPTRPEEFGERMGGWLQLPKQKQPIPTRKL